MAYSDEIFERALPPRSVPRGLPLVVLLTGFTDAGGVVAGLISHFRDGDRLQTLGVFDNDVLLDYRARRPIITFASDHLTDYRPPRLELSLSQDVLGQPFLLLCGYEPDFAWETFAEVVLDAADEYDVSSVSWVHAIGMPVPHTRPLGVTVSGNRSEITEAHSSWQPHTQVPATAGHLLEYRFAEEGLPVTGWVMLVPHYLSETDYPGAMLAALEKLTVSTGLVFATDEFTSAQTEFLERVEEQVTGNEELQRMISGLEERYDAYTGGRSSDAGDSLLGGAPLPSADEIAAELERFLASRPTGEDDRGPGAS